MNFNIDNLMQKVTETLTTKTVIGEPLKIDRLTLIPVMNVSFGFGGGGGDGRSNGSEQGSGSGGGGGARMTVCGMVVVNGDQVSFVSTAKTSGIGGSLEKLVDALPGLMEKIKSMTSKEKEEPAGE